MEYKLIRSKCKSIDIELDKSGTITVMIWSSTDDYENTIG